MQADDAAPPKPLTKLAGTVLLDWMIEKLIAAGVAHIIINIHFKADMIIDHVRTHTYGAKISLSDERAGLLDTGGGVAKAHALLETMLASELQDAPFFICNADIIWLETHSNLQALSQTFDVASMDACLLLTKRAQASGYEGRGDFNMDAEGHIIRPERQGGQGAYVYAGVQVAHPRLLTHAPPGAFPLNLLWDKALAKMRLYGHVLVGEWMHVGTKQALAAAQKQLTDKGQTLSPPPKNKYND